MRVRLAWGLFALTVLTAVGHVALLVASRRPVFSTAVIGDGFPLVTLGAVAGAWVGAVIISRYPAHRIGWLFVVGQLVSELGLALRAYGYSALSGELHPAPGGHLAIWMSLQTGGLLVISLLAVLFLLAPDGRLSSPRWRWALALVGGGLLTGAAAIATVSPRRFDRNASLIGGDPGPVLTVMLVAASLAVGIGVLAAAVSLVLRLRRATGEERQQLRWMTLAAVALAVGTVGNMVLASAGAPPWVQPLPVMLAYACVPFLTGVAILRFHLYEIDLLINRAIILTVLTGLVALAYVAVVVVIGRVFPLTHGAFWPSLLAISLVALVVQPLRRRVERLADRLVYGARAAPYEALAEFSKRLQEAPGPEVLMGRVTEAVARAVGARHVATEVELPGYGRSRLGWPDDRHVPPQVTLPVVADCEELGRLFVTMPPGVALRPGEERLLEDFAHQLGGAVRKLRLEAALLDRVELLRQQSADLEASARRLSTAQAAERERFEADLARTVLPHLRQVSVGLAELRTRLGDDPSTDRRTAGSRLDELTASTTTALESLRILTRGVFPAQLARRGLVSALTTHVTQIGLGDVVRADPSCERRFDPRLESACYFCAVEALRELAPPVEVRLHAGDQALLLEVTGTASPTFLARTRHLGDRAAALAGTIEVRLHDGRAALRLQVPLDSGEHAFPHLQEPSRIEL